MAQPDRIHITESYNEVKAKKLKTGDRLIVGGRGAQLVKIRKNAAGGRVLTLTNWSSSGNQLMTLIVDKNYKMRITRNKTITPKK